MRQVKKRLFAATLSLAMLFSLFPASVFADEAEAMAEAVMETAKAQDADETEDAEITDDASLTETFDDVSLLEGEEASENASEGGEASESVPETKTPEDSPQYVLMNIPYADFYAAELGNDAAAVDAVTSATLNKPRTGTLAGGSYHVNSDGSDISGVIYPVLVPDMSALDGKTQITDSSGVSITVTNRGQETTTEYKGRDALFESESYSYYILSEAPAYYKELTAGADGAFMFGPVVGNVSTVNGVEGEVTIGGRHADIEIKLTIPENGGIAQGATVSGVILTDADGAKYGLRHVVNVWRGTELGWNLGELDLNGKTISNILYITQTAVYDYPVTLTISNPGYVLMNIPYAEFYAAELDGGAVDAVTTATLKFENKGVAAGSYHVNDSATDEGSDLTGATYPVFVPDLSALDAKLEVKATDKKTFNLVTGREKTVTATEVEGSDILFCAPSYSWFRLTEKPVRYKALTVESGAFTFGAVSGRAATVNDVSVRINYETHHGNDAEIVLTGTGIESNAIVGGVVLTDSDGAKYGLPHVQGIWSRTQLGWPDTTAIAGKTFTNARFILRDSVIDCPVEFTVKPKMAGALSATFTGARELTLGGLAGDIANAKATVTYTTGERPNTETHTVADGVAIVDGKVTLTEDAISGQSYTVKVESDNYGDKSASVQASDAPATPENPGGTDNPATPDTPDVFEYENAPLTFQSARNYGGAATDAFHDVAYTPDGGFVVMGYSFGESSDPAWTHTGSGNNNDAILLKFDSDYKLQWSKAYGGDGVDVFNAIDVLKDGRIAAIGRSSFTSEDANIKNVSWYLLLIDPDNPDNYTDYRIGGTAGDQGYGVAATSDGGFVAAGWSASKSGFVTHSSDRENYSAPVQLWGEQDRIAASGSDSVIIKFDSAGNVQYAVLHNYCVSENANNISSPSERLDAIAVDSADNIYLVGYDAVAKNAQNAVIAKLSGADGSLLWHRSAGRQDQTTAPENAAEYIKAEYSGVAVLKDDSVVVTGTSTGDATTEEGWKITGVKDTLVTRYSADGKFLFSDSFGTIDDNNSRPEGILATPDGGYIVYGSQAGVMQEDALVSKGYDWGNYGGQDAILVKYGADNTLAWAENYGSNMGDWINGMAVRPNGELIAVGESNGQNGVPAWGNNGGLDGVILCAGVLPDAYAGTGAAVSDGNVTWADGSYTATGNGFGGADSIEVTLIIEAGKIASVDGESHGDSAAYYTAATDLHDTIVERQSADVDGVTGATYSSNGIKEAASKALGQSAAAYVDSLIAAIADADTAKSAADAYAELGTYSVGQLKNLTALQSAAKQYGVTLVSRTDSGGSIAETKPESVKGLLHNDPYYKLQNQYYQNIHAESFEKDGIDGEGVKIAVIDSGLNPSHQDLDYSRVLEGYDYDNDVVMGRDSLTDNNGHGTAVTGILAAVADNETGVAGLFGKLQVIPLKVTPVSPDKDTDGASSKLVARAITDAVDKYQADVITTSLDVKDTEELAQAVAYAASKGLIITGASGNSSKEENNGNDPYVYPASYDDVISVGAVDANNKIRANSQKNDKVFVAAPGENIAVLDLSMSGRCKLASGTSYASPLVAAMAVAAKQYKSDITPAQFKTLLQTSSVDAGAEGYDTSYGYGIVDYAAFLDALKSADFPEADKETYVLMNIPYADFYAAELNANAAAVDAVTSATLNKPRTGTLAGGSYHVNSDGSDISGVIYPVLVPDMSALDGKTQITDSSSVSITVTNRGQETTTEYKGREALFESASYSHYVLDETPAYYKELTVGADGAFTFGPVVGNASTVNGVAGETTIGGRHADIEIKLTIPEDGGIVQGAAVSGVVLTDSDGAKYGLRHVVNVWRGTELGWNLGELDLNGKTITNIRYITQDAVYDYPLTLAIGNPGYVLMNIPYAEFYAAELDGGAVDAVTTATLKFENKGVAAGSYHVNDSATDEGSDLTGATYPVFVPDLSALDAKLEVKATDKKTFNLVTGREKTVTATEVEGSDILFCAPSYSWFRLTEKPARYKALTVENGAFTFGAVSGRAATVNDVSVRISYETHHGNDAEIVLTGTGIESGAIVGGVVLTDSDGAKYGLPHVQGIWSRTQLGWPNTSAIAGKTFTNARFLLRDSVIDCPVEFTVKPKMAGALSATFTGARELTLGGLATNTENAKVTVTYTTGERPNTETHTVADGAKIVNGKVTLTEDAISGQAYTVKVESDNYGDKSASVQAPDSIDTPASQGGCYVATAVYGSYDCPEVWTLRRFRDNVLAETWYGRLFIRFYYAVSPTAVKLFGDAQWFQDFFRARLDTLVSGLQDDGFESTPYEDTVW